MFSFYSVDDISWSLELKPVTPDQFTEIVGLRSPLPTSPLKIFSLFFTSSLLNFVVVQTNKFALECMGGERFAQWSQVTVPELQAYIGFMVLMGIVHLPSIYDYWKKDEVFHYSPVASRISRDRFFELHKYLHFADNSTLPPPGNPGYSKLGKIQHIINKLGESFYATYCPSKNLSIDEAMIPFKGRSTLKQYMPLKPVKRGIKVWAMSDAQNGYMSAFEIYTGKKGTAVEKKLGSRVVKTLLSPNTNTYRYLYFDNFFTSVDLLLHLLRCGLYGCGTFRTNRHGFPAALKVLVKRGLGQRGHSKTFQSGHLTASIWQDNKPVAVVATNSHPTISTSVPRRNRDGSRMEVTCPQSVALYNKFMGGVDRNDQLRGYYNVRMKCRKLYKYIFWFLLDVSITNSYILYKCFASEERKISDLKSFGVELAKSLVADYCSRKRPGRPSTSAPVKRFCAVHFPTQGAEKGRRCHYCYKYKHTRHETVWYCKDCNLFLCHNGREGDCFLQYHTYHVTVK